MSMSQTEWARRVAAIGKMAGWQSWFVIPLLEAAANGEALNAIAIMHGPKIPASSPAVIAAIRQLCADWLAAEGVVAVRWRTGTPKREGEYWIEYRGMKWLKEGKMGMGLIYNPGGFYDGKWKVPRGVTVLRWQELDGLDYEVTHG